MLTPEQTLAALGDTTSLENFGLHWDESMAQMPQEPLFLLEDAFWQEQLDFIETPEAAALAPACAKAAALMRDDAAIRTLVWHSYWRVFLSPKPDAPPSDWPEPECLGELRGIPYLLAGLAFMPLVRKTHAARGIPVQITRDTCGQVIRYCNDNYKRGHNGRTGVYQRQLGWLRHYTCEPYFRIGRLEYWLKPSVCNLTIYHNRKNGRTIAFPDPETRFSQDGLRFQNDDEYGDDSWLSTLKYENGYLIGTPYTPFGRCSKNPVHLPLDDWELIFTRGNDTFNMHIPSGGHMTPDACRNSFLAARAFFRRYFPDRPVRAATCGSWIFNPDLQDIFPADSNLVRFQRELYLYPAASGPWDGLWFIFLKLGPIDLETAPHETTLQKKVLEHLRSGHRWRTGNMFILLDDVDAFGHATYRNQWTDGMP